MIFFVIYDFNDFSPVAFILLCGVKLKTLTATGVFISGCYFILSLHSLYFCAIRIVLFEFFLIVLLNQPGFFYWNSNARSTDGDDNSKSNIAQLILAII